ncbi:hypothetical protein [Clostridium sp. DL1XJH146]
MAFPVTPAVLTDMHSIDAVAEAKAGILQTLSELFYEPDAAPDPAPAEGNLVYNIEALTDFDTQISLMKNTLCAYACEELSAAKLVESLACKLAVEKGLVGGADDCCKCCCCSYK